MAKVRDLMTTNVVTVKSTSTLKDAARLMRDEDVGVLPVVDSDELRGVITDRDIVVRGLVDGDADRRISEILESDVIFVSPDDDEKDAHDRMADNDVRRLPVVENGKLVGILSVGDLAVRANSKLAGKVMEKTGPDD